MVKGKEFSRLIISLTVRYVRYEVSMCAHSYGHLGFSSDIRNNGIEFGTEVIGLISNRQDNANKQA